MPTFAELRAASTSFARLRSQWLGDGGEPVAEELAQARANTCLACPLNEHTRFYEPLAKGVVDLLIAKPSSVGGESNLHICAACCCVLALKVWVPLKHILAETGPEKHDYHPQCWVRAEASQLTKP